MKIKCRKQNLLNGLRTVSRAVPSKTTMSILQCILVDCSRGNIRLIANDNELGIETIVEGEILEKGIIALDAKILVDIVSKLPDNDILISCDENYITNITCEKSRFNIVGKSGDEFAYLPEIKRENKIVLSQFTLREVIRQTIFSIAANENNKVMTGELFDIRDGYIRVIALDGHRISIRNIELRDGSDTEGLSIKKIIIPGKTLGEISKIITGDSDDDVNIYISDRNVVFEFDDTIVLSRLIEGEYFNVDQMISNDYSTKVTVNKREFTECIDRASLLVKEGDKKPIIVNVRDDEIEIKINSTIGSLNEVIDIGRDGKDMRIGFNPKFLIDVLRVIDDDVVDLYLLSPKSPCIIRDEDGTFIYLVLPVNINTVD